MIVSLGMAVLVLLPAQAAGAATNDIEVSNAVRTAGGVLNGYRQPDGSTYYKFFQFPKSFGVKQLKSIPTPNFRCGFDFEGTSLDDEALKDLARFTTVDELNLSLTQVTDEGLKNLSKLTQLRMLGLVGTKVTDAGLKGLAPLTNLERLYLLDTSIKGTGFKDLAPLKKLTLIGLSQPMITDESITGLVNAGLLQFASFVQSGVNDRSRKLSDVTFVALGGTAITDKSIKHIASFSKVRRLYLNNTALTDEGLKDLAGLTEVTELSLHATKITNAGLRSLTGLKSLKNLFLTRTAITSDGEQQLLRQLPGCKITR